MKAIEQVYEVLQKLEQKWGRGIAANEISDSLRLDRANISRYLNRLHQQKKVEKLEGRPVLYCTVKLQSLPLNAFENESSFDKLAVIQTSLQIPIQQAKAAILYPPKGLHTLLLGETGVGKSMFAELMYQFAWESGVLEKEAPFIRFNCADYAENSQLLVSQIFGVKKGAYTGADKDREGLLKKAHGGFLFLDEVHRLSPQGQEMLFTFIDKGTFRPLGETERVVSSEVRIIAATTEQPQSYLLNTFTRRIPMMIELPALRHKDLSERYHLIELFIKHESKRIGKSIYADKNTVIAFLLYDCPNNIGQLKSDIQLSCAKAFVNYKAKKDNYILLSDQDLPKQVRKGIMRINECREEIDFLLKNKSSTLRFSVDEAEDEAGPELPFNEDFYDRIENKLEAMRSSGMKDDEINHAINLDLEENFNKYIGNIPNKILNKDIKKLIDPALLDAAKGVLALAEERLQRSFDQNIEMGLAMHLQSFVERMRKGIKIYHPKLNMIRIEHPEEFMAAMEAAKILDGSFHLHTPLDEIGYITMFLSPKHRQIDAEEKSTVGVLVIMHGNSTASSMVEVCNTLNGVDHAAALDMPLSMSPRLMYEHAKEKVLQLDRGRGVMLLVDMGSLTSFGPLLQEETGIVIRVADKVSTPIVLEACRKAVMGRDIHSIHEGLLGEEDCLHGEKKRGQKAKKHLIITACFTGEGASERLKRILADMLPEDAADIKALNIMNKKDFLNKVEQYKEKYHILAVVSTLDIRLPEIPFISAAELLAGSGARKIRELVQVEQNYQKIGRSLEKHVGIYKENLVKHIREALHAMEQAVGLRLKEEVKIGMLLHISFLLDKLKKGGQETHFEGLEDFRTRNGRELAIVQNQLRALERDYGVQIGSQEAAYICKMLLSNKEEENLEDITV
jgi:transcriptional regulatory protein LevR/transcriptional regulator with AAA-type ATPase domain